MAEVSGPDKGLESLEELEGSQEERPARQEELMEALLHKLSAGAPPPADNPRADKAYYRFLFAGVLVLVGCLMPFGPQPHPGYYSFAGGIFLIIALGLVWSEWRAIHSGRFFAKWVLLMLIPLAWSTMQLIGTFNQPAVQAWIESDAPSVAGWGEFVSLFGLEARQTDPDRWVKASEFIRHLGTGKLFVFLGSLLAVVFFVQGILGGARRIKQQKAERRRR